MRFLRLSIILLICAVSAGFSQTIKFATYNIYFLDDGINVERKANLRAVLNTLDADVIGFQEIQDREALENILNDDYEIAFIDDPNEVQELGLAVKKPFTILSQKYAFPDTAHNFAFPRKRDVLVAEIEGHGQQFTVMVHHAKSRSGGRNNNDARREEASAMMVDYIRNELAGKNVVILGDFNDTPDDKSANILEYGDRNAVGGIDEQEDTFMFNTTEQLLAQEHCSFGYSFMFQDSTIGETFDPTVPGARAENNKWRGVDHDYFNDVEIKETLLDQIFISIHLKENVVAAGVFNYAVAVKGSRSRIRFEEQGLVYTERGSLASDHIPVWVALEFGDSE